MDDQLFNLIEYTSRSIFLTGRAGTGKTTFLTEFAKRTAKNFVIVAPTGIAALNAGGVTIHSMFYLPLTTFVPTIEEIDRNIAINIQQLVPHFKYRKDKLKLLRKLEVLIIDEVSMLRADVLDMIDVALRSARRSTQAFGGVQLLLIGDLYQLPPVVKPDAERILYKYYSSPFFFEAKALEKISLLTIELTKVYRQSDEHFLQLLNDIRENNFDALNFDLLHSRYHPSFEPQESYVYLVSHNYMADDLNAEKLKQIPNKLWKYDAVIKGDFKEHLYPNEVQLNVKAGAQVMFIRNDSSEEKRYYNGLLAKIIELDDATITVIPEGQSLEMQVQREVWENIKYYVDNENKIQEEVIGKYEQFPFRLAWAVTIHKSQGLTFDKVIIDAGQSFASGQVYVALSRCRTLEGIVLKSRIHASAITNDSRIAGFQYKTKFGDDMSLLIEAEKYQYTLQKMLQRLDMRWMKHDIQEWEKDVLGNKILLAKKEEEELNTEPILKNIDELTSVYEKFLNYTNALDLKENRQENWKLIEAKSSGAVKFFFEKVNKEIFLPLLNFYAATKGVKGLKEYNHSSKSLLDSMEEYLSGLASAALFEKKLFEHTQKVSAAIEKKPSHLITYEQFQKGKMPSEIARERNVTIGTIYDHLSKAASDKDLDIDLLFSKEHIALFKEKFDAGSCTSLTQYKETLTATYEFYELRLLLNYFKRKQSRLKQEIPPAHIPSYTQTEDSTT